MANDEGGEKTEQPTGHKLGKAREQGQVAKSMEVTSSLVLLVAGGALYLLGPLGWDRLTGMFRHFVWRIWEIDASTVEDLFPWLILALKEALILVLPLALIIMVVAVAVNIYQMGGFLFVSSAMVPKFSKLNFIKGFGRFFTIKSLVEMIKSILKISIVFYVAYLVIIDHVGEFVLMPDMDLAEIGLLTLKVALELFFKICLLLFIMSVLDYGYQKWQFMRDMRMTKQEIKDEFKQMEGDPVVKSRIRQIQREVAKKRMLADVGGADVVIANPTHFAVALLYDGTKHPAPLVVAKGQDFLAQRIKDIAKENKVPIVENKPLAQTLYRAVEVGQIIPTEFYKAVAEVLSYVYRVKGRKKRSAANG